MWRRVAMPALVGLAVLLLSGASGLGRPPSTEARYSGSGPAAPRSLNLVGLGDSVTAGTNCGCTPFVQLTGRALARRTGWSVRAVNDGVAGLDTAGLIQDLAPGTATSRDVAGADVVLITIGANDQQAALNAWPDCDRTCATAELPGLAGNLTKLVAAVRTVRAGRPTLIVLTDYWNVFEDGTQAVDDFGAGFPIWSDELTDDVNATIRSAAARSGVTFVDLKPVFRGSGSLDPTPLLAADGDHPNAAGHRAIAAALATRIVAGHLLPTGGVTRSPAASTR